MTPTRRPRGVVAAAILVPLLLVPTRVAAQRARLDGDEPQASARERAPAPSTPAAVPQPAPVSPGPAAVPRPAPPPSESTATESAGAATSSPADGSARPQTRTRTGRPAAGTAVPRGSVPPPAPAQTVVAASPYDGFWPWGFGGLGFGRYYGGFYDPYLPWYTTYLYYTQPGVSAAPQGALRLKVKPRDAQVWVDGYYVGIVDDYDGVFQRLHLAWGPHHVEVRAPEYESLILDVQIRADQTTTYRGDLAKLP